MKKVDFSDGRIVNNILQTALPLLVAQFVTLLYNIVDRIYIGRIPGTGTEALGAVGLCFPIIILITGFTNLYGLGGAPLFSMELGRNRPDKAAAILNSAFRLELLTAAIIVIIGEMTAGPLLVLFGAEQSELAFAVPYLRIYLIGTAFSMISTGMNPYINAQGFSVIGMTTVLIGAAANLVLDPLFIFVFGMGVSGAAVATVISQLLSAAFVMHFLLGKRNEFRLSREKLLPSDEKANGAVFPYAKDIISLGVAPFVMQVTNSLVSIVCNAVLIRTAGAMYVSVMTIISSIRQILDTPIHAITEGSSPCISFNYGAQKPGNIRKAMKLMTIMAVGYTLLMWLLIELEPQLLIGIFTSDAELQELTVRPLHLYFFAFIFQSFQYSGQTTFKALNKKKKAVFFSLFRKVILVVPLTLLLPYAFGMGTDGVFIAEPVSNLVGGLACFTTMLLTILPELKRMEQAQ